jgi:butyryl-CoA dehydrogenase
MDFEYSPQQQQVRETIARFVAHDIAPLVAEAEESEVFPRELFRK